MATISRSGIAAASTISATHITNIIDALDGVGVTTIVATGSFSGSFKGNLTGVATSATSATTATSASFATNAQNIPFTGITSLPAGIGFSGVASIDVTDITGSVTASNLVNGTFYILGSTTNSMSILLDSAGGMQKGTEFTFFASSLDYSASFTTGSPAESIISENGFLSVYGTGSAVTAKLINTGPVTWALIGSLKA